MKVFTFEIHSKLGPDGQLPESAVTELKAQLEKALEDVPPGERPRAREKMRATIDALRDRSPISVSLESIVEAIEHVLVALNGLPRGLRSIAQTSDNGAHIFELGGTMGEIVTAMAVLSGACASLRDLAKCEDKHHQDPPLSKNKA